MCCWILATRSYLCWMSFFLLIRNNIVFVNNWGREETNRIQMFVCVLNLCLTMIVYVCHMWDNFSLEGANDAPQCWLQIISLNVWNSNSHNLTPIFTFNFQLKQKNAYSLLLSSIEQCKSNAWKQQWQNKNVDGGAGDEKNNWM